MFFEAFRSHHLKNEKGIKKNLSQLTDGAPLINFITELGQKLQICLMGKYQYELQDIPVIAQSGK